MSGDFVYQPQPGDWDLPDKVKSGMDPVQFALLSEAEFEGMPVGVGFQASREYAQVSELIAAGADSDAISERLAAVREQWERRYPGAPMWDRIHRSVATEMAEKGYRQEAVGLAMTIISPYEKLKAIRGICEAGEDNEAAAGGVLAMFGSLIEGADQQTCIGLMRALRDDLIEDSGDPEMVASIDQTLAESGAEADPVSGWLESRKTAEPQFGWSLAEAAASQDIWPAGISDYWKRSVLLTATEILWQIDASGQPFVVADAVGMLDDFETQLGSADIWSQLKAGLALRAYDQNRRDAASEIALSVSDARYIGSIALELAAGSHQQEAIELSARNPDPQLAVELLLDGPWQDGNDGITMLTELIGDEAQPKERRIAIMKVVRDRFVAIDALASVVTWQNMIDELEAED